MLIEFNVKNFRSMKGETTFSLLASKDKLHENNLIINKKLKKDRLLKSAVIYGANASGKSNVLIALNTMKSIITNSHRYQQGEELNYQPFKLDPECTDEPTEFNVVFIKNDIQYNYGFSYDSSRIINETLYWYPRGKKALVFSRKNTNEYKFTEDKKKQAFFSERTPENVLYLSRATQLNYEITKEPIDWFISDLRIILATDHPGLNVFTNSMIDDEKSKRKILKALEAADVGIDDIRSERVKLKEKDLPQNIPVEIKEIIAKSEQTRITTIHNGVKFDFNSDESDGTRRLYALIGPIIEAIENDRVLVIDEIDTKLHHLLNVFIIRLFHSPDNDRSQLIFNIHNTNLLDRDLFRRDQIWFTEKDPSSGETDLYSLLEFRPRNDVNIQKGYLAGRYGALPIIKTHGFLK